MPLLEKSIEKAFPNYVFLTELTQNIQESYFKLRF